MNVIPKDLFPVGLWQKLSSTYASNSGDIGIAMEMVYGLNGNIIPTEKEMIKVIENAKGNAISLIDSVYEIYKKNKLIVMDYNEMIIKFCNLSNLSIDILLKKLSRYRSSDRTIYDFFIWKSEFPSTDTDILLSEIGIESYKYMWRDPESTTITPTDLDILTKLKNDYFHSDEYSETVVKWMKK